MTNSLSTSPASSPRKLSFWTKFFYGAGDFGTAITAQLQVFFLHYFLTNVAGIEPALAGSVLLVGKVWDAINDPMIGVLSDRTRHPWGRRYPWMVFGAIPFGLCFFLQWVIPAWDANTLLWYYIIIAILFNTFYTVVNLPYAALTPELSEDYNERTSLNSFRFAFSLSGSIISLILAQIIFQVVTDPIQQYLVLGGVCAIISVVPVYLCVLGTRHHVNPGAVPQDPSESVPFLEQLKSVFSNRAFLYVIEIYLCSWLGVQLTASILPYFVVSWMRMPETDFPLVAIVVQGTALIMLFVWTAISKRIGKRKVYFCGMGLWILVQGGLFFLQPEQIPFLYFLAVLAGVGVATAYLIPWSMIPDVIDLDELNTGVRREGIFYSFMVMLQKIGLAIGLQIVGIALQAAGFIPGVPGVAPPQQPESALFAIRLAIGPIPTIVLIIGIIVTYFYPISQEVHAEILLKLHERRHLENAGDPPPEIPDPSTTQP